MKLCCRLSVLRQFHVGHVLGSWRSVLSLSWHKWFSCKRGEWKIYCHGFALSTEPQISIHFVVWQTMWKKNCLKGGAASAATLFFLHSTNHIIDLWRCRHCCRRRFFDSILLAVHRTILIIATPLPRFSLVTYRSTCHIFLFLPDYCCGRENTVRHKS